MPQSTAVGNMQARLLAWLCTPATISHATNERNLHLDLNLAWPRLQPPTPEHSAELRGLPQRALTLARPARSCRPPPQSATCTLNWAQAQSRQLSLSRTPKSPWWVALWQMHVQLCECT